MSWTDDIRMKKNLYGLVGLCGWVVSKLLWKLRIRLYVRHCYSKATCYCPPNRTDYVAREISFDEFKQQFEKDKVWFTPDKIKSLKVSERNGDYVVGVFDGDLLIGYGLVSLCSLYNETIELKPTDSYLYDSYVHPDYRGHRLHEEINRARINLSFQHNRQRAITGADWYNRASIKAKEREGFVKEETYTVLRFRNFRICTRKYNY